MSIPCLRLRSVLPVATTATLFACHAAPVAESPASESKEPRDPIALAIAQAEAPEPAAARGCGNGQLDPGETCDDANTDDGDGCSSSCATEDFRVCEGTGPGSCEMNKAVYLKASDTRPGAAFGTVVTSSADGSTLAVLSPGSASDADAAQSAGLYVFSRVSNTWRAAEQLLALKDGQELLASAMAMSADGRTIAIAGQLRGDGSPHVMIFEQRSGQWAQSAQLRSSAAKADQFGAAIALSADGKSLFVGAPSDEPSSKERKGKTAAPMGQGAVYQFRRDAEKWVKKNEWRVASNAAELGFGSSLAVSADGQSLLVGAPGDDADPRGATDELRRRGAKDSGAAYFIRVGAPHGDKSASPFLLKAPYAAAADHFGATLAISANGRTLAIGSNDASAIGGNDANPSDRSAEHAGAVYVYTLDKNGKTWAQQAYLKSLAPKAEDWFSASLSLSESGDALALGAPGEAAVPKPDKRQNKLVKDKNKPDTREETWEGVVHLFRRTDSAWARFADLKSPSTLKDARFGESVWLSPDAAQVVVGAIGESSGATGVNGDRFDNSAFGSGAVYVFQR